MHILPTCSDYVDVIGSPHSLKVELLKGGNVEMTPTGKIKRFTGGFCIVFPYIVGNKKYAVRCWHASVNKIQERTKIISDFLRTIDLPYFSEFNYYDHGIITNKGIMPIVVMDWIPGYNLKEYINTHLDDSECLKQLARKFYYMAIDLHKHKVSHGDLQHGNILVTIDGDIKLVDYDSLFVPGLEDFDDDIKGLKGYQHHTRFRNSKLSFKADYFSEIIIYTSLIALSKNPKFWVTANMHNSEHLLFTEEDFKCPKSSNIFRQLEKDDETKILSNIIKDFLSSASIDLLLPLEKCIQPPKSLNERLSTAWADNGYVPPQSSDTMPTDISGKWANVPSTINNDNSIVINNIANKW